MEKKTDFKSMGATHKAKLIVWLNGNKELCERLTGVQLQKKFIEETGIDASLSSIFTYKKALFPDIAKKRPVGGNHNGGKLLAMISELDKRLSLLESAFN